MTTAIRLLLVGFVLILLLALGAWWYLLGPDSVLAAELVPADTVAFLTIPNAGKLTVGYETSQLKKLVDAPEAKPIIDAATDWIGQKNADLIRTFLPNLSGQSFIAITHFDPDKPEQTSFIAGMKPKMGTGNFDAFVEKLKATYPELLQQGTTGTGNVEGVDYQWIKGPGATDKICVAKLKGWIVTTWGEASLGDWIQRLQKKSSSPSLAQNADYQTSLARLGKDSMTLVYLNAHALAPAMQSLMHGQPNSNHYLEKRVEAMGGMAVGTRFEQGEIVDHFSFLMPRQAQTDAGLMTNPCTFDTLKFTGPDTRFYWAFNLDWTQAWKGLQEQSGAAPQLGGLASSVQTWVQGEGIDLQRNVLDALGPEISLQAEWNPDTTYPDVGFFVKVNKPNDFKPTITAIIDTIRKNYGNVALINEISADDRHYATLKFVQAIPITPTITEDGDYFGIFLTENHAVRCFKRDNTTGLLHNADFLRQIGDKRNGASQILFLDSPQIFDRGYRTAMPYLSLAAMLNKDVAATLKNHPLPNDLAWLAPMGTWSLVTSSDDNGGQGYSISGVGNQGIFLGAGLGTGVVTLQTMGLIHPPAPPVPPAPPISASPSASTNETLPPASPDTLTNSPSNSASPSASPDATTNPPPSPAPTPAPAAASNSDAPPNPPDQPPKPQ